jgi:hypothetical protein
MNCKGFGRKQLWPNFKVLPRHSPGRTERYHENISQDSRSEDRDSNAGPTECEAGVLTTWPRRPIVRVVLGRYYWTEIAPETFSAGRPQIPNFILSSSVTSGEICGRDQASRSTHAVQRSHKTVSYDVTGTRSRSTCHTHSHRQVSSGQRVPVGPEDLSTPGHCRTTVLTRLGHCLYHRQSQWQSYVLLGRTKATLHKHRIHIQHLAKVVPLHAMEALGGEGV